MPIKEKDEAAQSMAKKRWANTDPEERSEVARRLNEARWGKKRKGSPPKANLAKAKK
jgi:acyl-CoA reductase-like NAD-dependent aldehyde dehydrogenase